MTRSLFLVAVLFATVANGAPVKAQRMRRVRTPARLPRAATCPFLGAQVSHAEKTKLCSTAPR